MPLTEFVCRDIQEKKKKNLSKCILYYTIHLLYIINVIIFNYHFNVVVEEERDFLFRV